MSQDSVGQQTNIKRSRMYWNSVYWRAFYYPTEMFEDWRICDSMYQTIDQKTTIKNSGIY